MGAVVANTVAVDVVPPVAFEFGEQAVRHGVDDREVVGQDVRSAVEEDVAVRTEVQKVLREVGTAVLPGPDMSRFAVAMAGRGQDQGGVAQIWQESRYHRLSLRTAFSLFCERLPWVSSWRDRRSGLSEGAGEALSSDVDMPRKVSSTSLMT